MSETIAHSAKHMKSAGLELRAVRKDYGSNTVLHSIDLRLEPGELVCLLGPSGCGKTTALRCLAGLEEVTSGQVLIGGDEVSGTPVNRRDIGMVFQAYSLFPHMTVAKNVEFGLRMRKIPRSERTQRVAEALELVGLSGFEHRYASQLSGGQQQRVALARALVTRPRALLLDEPLSALDAKVRVHLREQIREIVTELGITTVFVTHDQEEALAISDRVAVMNGGHIEQFASPEDIYRSPASAFVADFVGVSNKLPGVLTGQGVQLHQTTLPLVTGTQLAAGTSVTALVRPEHIAFAASVDAQLHGTVVSSGFLGSLRRTVVRLDELETEAAVQHHANERLEIGETVGLRFAEVPVAIRAEG
ncbi:ABC transporter ATP-binding protein [Glutamicibacter endophyticus]|uniref:ABC transporter ATP-binding protein n=1 Tax=Glutamicibacter endophyticus TaxID=1522174 RepID=UPI003AEFA294